MSNQQKKIDKTVGFYDTFSTKYDRRYSAYLEHTHKRLLDAMDLSAGERILDISCGTGFLAEELLSRYPDIQLTLNDPSKGMLKKAKERFKNRSSVQFTNHTAEGIRFDEESFDRVICLNSFHYYADQPLVIENISRVLKPGGRFIILDWNREGWFHIPNAIISCLSREHINTRSLAEMKALLASFGFKHQSEKRWWFRFWKFYLVEVER